jgi:hypothetical protein
MSIDEVCVNKRLQPSASDSPIVVAGKAESLNLRPAQNVIPTQGEKNCEISFGDHPSLKIEGIKKRSRGISENWRRSAF